MKIIENLRAKWKAMTPAEKFKLVISGICDVGADLLSGYICCRLVPEDTKTWKKAACIMTMGGLGMKAGEIAANQLNDLVDILAAPKEEDDA